MARWRVLWRFAPKQNKDVDVKSKVSQWSQCAMPCVHVAMWACGQRHKVTKMEAKVDAAVASNDHAALASIFSPLGGWQSLGQGEQRVLASYFIRKAVTTAGFLPAAFASDQAMSAFAAALGHLPPTVEGAADNKLRESMFEYKVSEEDDYSGAALILAGLRMDDTEGSVYYMSAADRCDGELISMAHTNEDPL